MRFLPDIFVLLITLTGGYYLFCSQAAQKLSGIEMAMLNRWRIRLRRVNGVIMILLAVALFAGVHRVDPQRDPQIFVLGSMGILALMAMMIGLALADLRLTKRLRQTRYRQAMRDAIKEQKP
jgi:hypothetical protein